MGPGIDGFATDFALTLSIRKKDLIVWCLAKKHLPNGGENGDLPWYKVKIHFNKYNTSKSCLLKSYPDFPTIIGLDGVQTIILLISKCGNKLDSFL